MQKIDNMYKNFKHSASSTAQCLAGFVTNKSSSKLKSCNLAMAKRIFNLFYKITCTTSAKLAFHLFVWQTQKPSPVGRRTTFTSETRWQRFIKRWQQQKPKSVVRMLNRNARIIPRKMVILENLCPHIFFGANTKTGRDVRKAPFRCL